METKRGATLGMTGSYNANSTPQLSLIQSSISFIKQALQTLPDNSTPFPTIIADFGSSHGSNSVYIIKLIIDHLNDVMKTERSFLIVHNDLPTNDWSALFQFLDQQEKNYFGLGNGRSFYTQCLPANSLTIGYSSTSLHWLSAKPCNISNHCVSLYAQGDERQAFKHQAWDDYRQFLENRSAELISGGILLLIITCVNEQGQSFVEGVYDLLYKCAKLLPLTDDELLNYTMPVYLRSYEECLDEELFCRYSLKVIQSETCCVDFKFNEQWKSGKITLENFTKIQTGFMRSGTESILKQTLETSAQRSHDDIPKLLDRFWQIYYEQVKANPHDLDISSYQTYLALQKL